MQRAKSVTYAPRIDPNWVVVDAVSDEPVSAQTRWKQGINREYFEELTHRLISQLEMK
jgi:hypothetical protein